MPPPMPAPPTSLPSSTASVPLQIPPAHQQPHRPQAVFAIWALDGYYYPAVTTKIVGDFVSVRFADGHEALIDPNNVVNLQIVLNSMNLEADCELDGFYSKCVIKNVLNGAYVVRLEDGTSEQVSLSQLRASFKTGDKVLQMFGRT
jgi:hypothetical protein